MLWGSGRLLYRAILIARSGVRRRVVPFLHGVFPEAGARRVAVGAAIALVTSVVVVAHPSGSSHHVAFVGGAPSFDVAAGSSDPSGMASVSVSEATHLSPGTLPAPRTSQRYALLVGINHAVGATPLQGAVTDALNVKQALLDYGFEEKNITTLLDADASRAAILKGLDDLVRETPATGVAVVVLAAHSRNYFGVDQLLAADGARIGAPEIASRLQHLRSRAWIALPTCFAGGYALPGIVGHNRVVTFASAADQESYELGPAGSYLIIEMVQRAMIERRAPYSVEAAFDWAQRDLEQKRPNRVPSMSDGVPGDLVLGDMPGVQPESVAVPPPAPPHMPTYAASSAPADPSPAPSPTPASNGRRYTVGVCSSRANVNCSSPSSP
jgi:Caspase domain